jgi:hypothetical protein
MANKQTADNFTGANSVHIYKLSNAAGTPYSHFYIGRNRLHWLYLKLRTRNDKHAIVVTRKQITTSVELKIDINKSLPRRVNR